MLLRGTFPSCNVAVSDFNQPQKSNQFSHSFVNFSPPTVLRQQYLFSSSAARTGQIVAVATEETENKQVAFEPSLADRLRLGSLTEDGLSYKEKFIVRCYEVGINKTATVETIANLLQEVGCNHAQSVGFSTDGFATTPTMRKLHPIWVTARMHNGIYKYPSWSDVVEIETCCQSEGRIGTRLDVIGFSKIMVLMSQWKSNQQVGHDEP